MIWLLVLELCAYIPFSIGADCKPVDYSPTRTFDRVANCPKEPTAGLKPWTDGYNKCYSSGAYIQDFECGTGNDVHYRTCMYDKECEEGRYLDESGKCLLLGVDCFYVRKDLVPKNVKLPNGTCTQSDWDASYPDYCSVEVAKPGCSPTGHPVELNYVVKPDGVITYVKSISVEIAQPKQKDSVFLFDRRLESKQRVVGDGPYCRNLQAGDANCVQKQTLKETQYRSLDKSVIIPYVYLGNCKTPVYGYGLKTVMVYEKTATTMRSTCTTCVASCGDDKIALTLPDSGEKIVRFCGKMGCDVIVSTEVLITIIRTFHSKISDEKLMFTIYDEARTYSYSLEATCKPMEICKAIDCTFCQLRFLNLECYSWYHYLIVCVILYVAMIFVGMLLALLTPTWSMTCFIIKTLCKLIRKIARLFGAVGLERARRVAKYADDVESAPLVKDPIYRPTSVRNTRSGIKPWFTILTILGMTMRVETWAPCGTSLVDNIKSESCQLVNGNLNCKQISLVSLPLLSYDQTSCLHMIGPKGDVVGSIQVTPTALQYKCIKLSEFWTRDVSFEHDHLVNCPNAGDCTEAWCAKVDKSTKVDGLPKLSYPFEQYCVLGPACWGHGCFFCTDSCHTVRWYAKPRSSAVYEVFSCSNWIPTGTIHVEWQTAGATGASTVVLSHGETKEVVPGLSLTLEFTVQDRVQLFAKKFITDSSKYAMVETSSPGQMMPGTIGVVQCSSKAEAADMKECKMAAGVCSCSPSGSSDHCDCTQVVIEKVFDGQWRLPVRSGEDYVEAERDNIYLKKAAYGSARVMLRSDMPMKGSAVDVPSCEVSIKDISGCHSCVRGASAKYTCRTSVPSTIVVSCGTLTNFRLECGPLGPEMDVRAHFSYPIIDTSCSTSCSKTPIKIYGNLNSVGVNFLSSGSHIQLAPVESTMSWAPWLTGFWSSLGWWRVGVVILEVLSITLMILFVHRLLSDVVLKNKRS